MQTVTYELKRINSKTVLECKVGNGIVHYEVLSRKAEKLKSGEMFKFLRHEAGCDIYIPINGDGGCYILARPEPEDWEEIIK